MKYYFVYHISKNKYLHLEEDGGFICTFTAKDELVDLPDVYVFPRTKKDAVARLGRFHSRGIIFDNGRHFKKYPKGDLVVREVEIALSHTNVDQDDLLMIQNAFSNYVSGWQYDRWDRVHAMRAGSEEFFKTGKLSYNYYVLDYRKFEAEDELKKLVKKLKTSGIAYKLFKEEKTISFRSQHDWQMFQIMFDADSNRAHNAQFIFDSMRNAMCRKAPREFFQPYLPEVLFS